MMKRGAMEAELLRIVIAFIQIWDVILGIPIVNSTINDTDIAIRYNETGDILTERYTLRTMVTTLDGQAVPNSTDIPGQIGQKKFKDSPRPIDQKTGDKDVTGHGISKLDAGKTTTILPSPNDNMDKDIFGSILRTKTGKTAAHLTGYKEESPSFASLRDSYQKIPNNKEDKGFGWQPSPDKHYGGDEWGRNSLSFPEYVYHDEEDYYQSQKDKFDEYRRPKIDLPPLDLEDPTASTPEDEGDDEVEVPSKRSNPGLFQIKAPCAMWLGPGQSASCCVGEWYDWPTCFCAGFISCDDTVTF